MKRLLSRKSQLNFNKISGFLLLISVIFLSGCTTFSEGYGNTKDFLFGEEPKEVCEIQTNFTCPACNCGEELDAAVFYFDSEVVDGLKELLTKSDDYVFCSFTDIDEKSISDLIIKKNEEITVKILMDKNTVFDCSDSCVPYEDSYFNSIYGAGVDIEAKEDVKENFCSTDIGLFLITSYPSSESKRYNALFLKSDGLRDIYASRFEAIKRKK